MFKNLLVYKKRKVCIQNQLKITSFILKEDVIL